MSPHRNQLGDLPRIWPKKLNLANFSGPLDMVWRLMEPAHPCKCWTPLRAHTESSWMLCRGESKEAKTPASDSTTFSQQSCCQHTHKIPLFLKPSRLFPRCPFRSLGQMLTRLLLTPFAAKFQRGLLLLLLLKGYKLGYLKKQVKKTWILIPVLY